MNDVLNRLRPLPSLEILRREFRYEPETGYFYHLYDKTPKTKAGMRAGYYSKRDYFFLCVESEQFVGSRIAWKMYYGVDPSGLLDHKNLNKHDTRIDNLRESTHTFNSANKKLDRKNTSGYKGVHYAKGKGFWRATIGIKGRVICLGSFYSPEAAHEAYKAAALRHFGEHANFG